MYIFDKEQQICEIGGIKFGGQPGEYPCVCVSSIFQKGDKVFEGKRKDGFNKQKALQLINMQEKLSKQTGIPGMADIVANTGQEFKVFIDFITSESDMPFCIDAWTLKPKLEGAAYCAEKNLLDRMFYNSLTVWEKDLETEVREIYGIGVKHVLLVAFDQSDQMPTGRISGTNKILEVIDKVGAKFESIFVDTSVMNCPATAFCSIANKMIKEKWGIPTASAPSNGSYMDRKRFTELWDFKGWSSTDAALQALTSFYYHDVIFSGPMAGANRIFPAVAQAESFLATAIFAETKKLPKDANHPLYKLFPEFVKQLKALA